MSDFDSNTAKRLHRRCKSRVTVRQKLFRTLRAQQCNIHQSTGPMNQPIHFITFVFQPCKQTEYVGWQYVCVCVCACC